MNSNKHKTIGNRGEAIALNYLRRKGYDILARQKRIRYAEVDIIARFGPEVIFVEVKTSTVVKRGPAEHAMSDKKRLLLCEAAELYADNKQLKHPIQFDIIGVSLGPKQCQITHLKDVLFPFDATLGSTGFLA